MQRYLTRKRLLELPLSLKPAIRDARPAHSAGTRRILPTGLLTAGDKTQAWWSYDTVVETFDRLAVPHVFTQPANDLLALLKLPGDARVLDVGAGTGVAALLALQSAGSGSLVVALDSSLGMLHLAEKKGLPWLVAGSVPGLPFSGAFFDGVIANFVLSHVPFETGEFNARLKAIEDRAKPNVGL